MLTNREKEIIQLAADGLSSKEIGRLLGISKRTVEAHLRASRDKLNARNTVNLVSLAHKAGIISSLLIICSLYSVFSGDELLRPNRARTSVVRNVRPGRPKRKWSLYP